MRDGFSVSGGGVGGNMFRFIDGGALCSLAGACLLVRFRWTRLVAAKLMLSGGLSSRAVASNILCSLCSAPLNPVEVLEVAVAMSRAFPR